MSTKESVIELIRGLPSGATVQDIVRAIRASGETDYTLDELSADDWALFVAQGLEQELADDRQDVYGSDGESPDDSR